MKKNLTKKLMLSVLTLAFAVVSLGASTFAWFTMSSNAKVSSFDANVKGAEGLEIAITSTSYENTTANVDKLVWYSGVLPTTAINAQIAEGFFFEALNSQGKGSFQKLNHTTAKLEAASEGYISFRLWFKSGVSDNLCLTDMNIEGPETVPTYTIDQEFVIASNTALTAKVGEKWAFDVANAARVSLVPQGLAEDDAAFVYEAKEVAGTDKNAGNKLGYETTNGAFEYYNDKVSAEGIKLTAPSEAAPASKQVTELDKTPTAADVILALEADKAAYVDVYVWIEGWDGECLNAIFDQLLTVDFEFYLEDKLTA